jgi:hypothetical protein
MASNTTRNWPSYFLLERGELRREVGVDLQHLAETNERAHDFDVHLNSAGAAEHARKHGYPLLRERIRPVLDVLASPTTIGRFLVQDHRL